MCLKYMLEIKIEHRGLIGTFWEVGEWKKEETCKRQRHDEEKEEIKRGVHARTHTPTPSCRNVQGLHSNQHQWVRRNIGKWFLPGAESYLPKTDVYVPHVFMTTSLTPAKHKLRSEGLWPCSTSITKSLDTHSYSSAKFSSLTLIRLRFCKQIVRFLSHTYSAAVRSRKHFSQVGQLSGADFHIALLVCCSDWPLIDLFPPFIWKDERNQTDGAE